MRRPQGFDDWLVIAAFLLSLLAVAVSFWSWFTGE